MAEQQQQQQKRTMVHLDPDLHSALYTEAAASQSRRIGDPINRILREYFDRVGWPKVKR